MKNIIEKTNVMRILDSLSISYVPHSYDPKEGTSGNDVSRLLNQNPEQVFKTLVTIGKSKNHYVFVIPVNCELDLKKAAKASDEKNIEMVPQKELLPLTGYIHGGCSPIGMKKQFPTFIDETAQLFDTIMVSGGKLGYQVEINPVDLRESINAEFINLTI